MPGTVCWLHQVYSRPQRSFPGQRSYTVQQSDSRSVRLSKKNPLLLIGRAAYAVTCNGRKRTKFAISTRKNEMNLFCPEEKQNQSVPSGEWRRKNNDSHSMLSTTGHVNFGVFQITSSMAVVLACDVSRNLSVWGTPDKIAQSPAPNPDISSTPGQHNKNSVPFFSIKSAFANFAHV